MKTSIPCRTNQRTLVGAFAGMCLIWGLTWIPIKIGVAAVPPLLFAATRGVAAGVILLSLTRARPALRDAARLVAVAFGANCATYSLLFWGMTRVGSGVAAAVSLSMTQISLLTVAVMLGEERLSGSKILAATLGIAGLLVVYTAELTGAAAPGWTLGVAAVALSAVAYGLGSVLSRDLLRRYPPMMLAGWVQLLGGAFLLVFALMGRPDLHAVSRAFAEPAVLLSWIFLVVFGSVVAFSLYLVLIRDWSPSRAGFHAFVSPAIALLAGVAFLGERIGAQEIVGILLMMTATGLALGRPREDAPA